MSDPDQELRTVLESNVGFDDCARWLEYARAHGFKRVRATSVPFCPDCSGVPKARVHGQYVYYSTLIRLRECAACGLLWADAHIDPQVIRSHFETAYKDDEYFERFRRAVFDYLVNLIDGLCPSGARVLDIGGARGHLMAQLVARRPDLRVVVNDISEAATSWVAHHLGFPTVTGDADELASHQEVYNVVVLSDVLYYEPKLSTLWAALSRLVCQGGSLVIRVPNKYFLMVIGQLLYRLTHTRSQRSMQDRIRFFNPEHVFVFRQRYLRRRLTIMGFEEIRVLPSPLLSSQGRAAARSVLFPVARLVNSLSRHTLVLTPAMILVGRCRRNR